MKFDIEDIVKFIPVVERPPFKPAFKTRLKWTIVAVVIYFILARVEIAGMIRGQVNPTLEAMMNLLGSRLGSLMTLGIGPIITAGIVLELLVGSKLINWDIKKPEYRAKFESWNKFLAILFSFIEAAAFVSSNAIPLAPGLKIKLLAITQIALGSIMALFLDDLVKKWGIGSGISLFILAGVSSAIIIQLLSPFVYSVEQHKYMLWFHTDSLPAGKLIAFFVALAHRDYYDALITSIPVISTIGIIAFVAYVQSIRVEVPIAYSMFRGFGRPWALNLLYTSTIPVIFAFALMSNFQLLGRIGLTYHDGLYCGPLGCYNQQGIPVSGFVKYVAPPRNFVYKLIFGGLTFSDITQVLIYGLIFMVLAVIFSVFWVETSGMDAESVAEQLTSYGFQIPGYRRDKRIIANILKKYINPLAVLSGIIVGLIAMFADAFSALGTGTGLLLSVTIAYSYYQQIKMERSEDMPEFLRKLVKE